MMLERTFVWGMIGTLSCNIQSSAQVQTLEKVHNCHASTMSKHYRTAIVSKHADIMLEVLYGVSKQILTFYWGIDILLAGVDILLAGGHTM